jgi:hypothetical protein
MSDNKSGAVAVEVVEHQPLVLRANGEVVVRHDSEVQAIIDESHDSEMARLHTYEEAENIGIRAARTLFRALYLRRYTRALKNLK